LIFSNGKYVFSRIAVAELPATWGIVMSLGIAASMVAISLLVAVARAADWLPVDPADLSLTVPKIEKDADAEVMFWDVRVDDDPRALTSGTAWTQYVRIKVFTARGRIAVKIGEYSQIMPTFLPPWLLGARRLCACP
jgi:hypothetical protein